MRRSAMLFTAQRAARGGRRDLPLLLLLGGLSTGCFYRDECSPAGASRCEQDRVMQCENHNNGEFSGVHTEWDSHPCSSEKCVQLTESQAACVESVDKEPRCGEEPSAEICWDGEYARCAYGYRLRADSCPANVDWGVAGASRCVEPIPFHAVCVPPDAQLDAACAGGSGPRCDGTTLVQCLDGYGVRTLCRSCAIYPQGYQPRWNCTGTAGYGCVDDADCADGLVCVQQPRSPQGFASPSVCVLPATPAR